MVPANSQQPGLTSKPDKEPGPKYGSYVPDDHDTALNILSDFGLQADAGTRQYLWRIQIHISLHQEHGLFIFHLN